MSVRKDVCHGKQGNLSSLVEGVVSYKSLGGNGDQVKSYTISEKEFVNHTHRMIDYTYLFVDGHWIVYHLEDGWNFLKDMVTKESVCEVA